jgi:hypothetical protein
MGFNNNLLPAYGRDMDLANALLPDCPDDMGAVPSASGEIQNVEGDQLAESTATRQEQASTAPMIRLWRSIS